MGLEVIAYAAFAVASVSAYEGIQSRKESSANYAKSAEENRKANREQQALNYQQQTEERRKLVREERVRRARLLQAAENTGSAGSSSEFGALGSMNTQLQANLGVNAARADAGGRISGYMQNAADFNTAAQQASMSAQNWDAIMGLSSNIFMAAGGFNAGKPPKG